MKFLQRFLPKPQLELPVEREMHEWRLVSKSYAPPRKDITGLESLPQSTIERALFGVTVYLWECKLTGDIRKEAIVGSDTPQMEELFQKARQFGPQFIKDDFGEIYEFKKYVPQVTNPLDLPMRNQGS